MPTITITIAIVRKGTRLPKPWLPMATMEEKHPQLAKNERIVSVKAELREGEALIASHAPIDYNEGRRQMRQLSQMNNRDHFTVSVGETYPTADEAMGALGPVVELPAEEPPAGPLVNLTPHVVNIHHGELVTTLEPDGPAPRCTTAVTQVGSVAGIPITSAVFGPVEGLPESRPGIYLVVSRLVAERCPDRTDLLVPGPAVRGEGGAVIGCQGLSRI